ncbi:MAG: DNA/RNA non-specific endonuclease [Muribaculum sp.]|nr:DNA/RNA non-specific endonuclease [Muribaculum sp.]
MKRKNFLIWIFFICCIVALWYSRAKNTIENSTDIQDVINNSAEISTESAENDVDYMVDSADILSTIPKFSGDAYIAINENIPFFTSEEKECTSAFEIYSDLDELGRCGVAYANICTELMPTDERGAIGQVKPSGWQVVKYDFVDGKNLYNRCHLIAYQLAGENANEKNLITGTRFFNVSGMLPFENMVYDYVKKTENHVLYRVTPLYDENDLVATGVLIEAYSVEDCGVGICFNVFIYNSQPRIGIDYATGDNWLVEDETDFADMNSTLPAENTINKYVLNTNSKKFHLPTCESVSDMKEKNKKEVLDSRDKIIMDGYSPCQRCSP